MAHNRLDSCFLIQRLLNKEKNAIIIAYAIFSNGIFTEPGTVLSSVSVTNISSLALNHLFSICSVINKNSFEYFSFKLNTMFSFLSREHWRIIDGRRGSPALCYRNGSQWSRCEFIQQSLPQPQGLNRSICDIAASARQSLSTALSAQPMCSERLLSLQMPTFPLHAHITGC